MSDSEDAPKPSSKAFTQREVLIGVFCALAATGVNQIPGVTWQSEACTQAGLRLAACSAATKQIEDSKNKAWCKYGACREGSDPSACDIDPK